MRTVDITTTSFLTVAAVLKEIAEMHTDTRLDEAHCFLKARTLAQETLREYDIQFKDPTFGGKS